MTASLVIAPLIAYDSYGMDILYIERTKILEETFCLIITPAERKGQKNYVT